MKPDYIYIYLSEFDKRYLQKFLATVSFEACSVLDHSCFVLFFLMIFSVFRKASLSHMKEQVSRLAKPAVVQYVTVFRLILAKRVNTDLGIETERHHIASFDVGGDESLASKRSF